MTLNGTWTNTLANSRQSGACDVEHPIRPNNNALLNPNHPERVCWGCDKYCPAKDLRCGNGTIRTPHPIELFGEGWNDGVY
jgi:hypothetical protein